MKRSIFFVLSILILKSAALAQTSIRFTQKELDAGVVLMKPELNTFELDEQSGTVTPCPSLRALGVDTHHYHLNFSGLSDLANIQFHHLKAKTPSARFEGESLVLTVPVEDQTRAASSWLGSVSTSNVVLTAYLQWTEKPDGNQQLEAVSTEISGTLTGTGALRPAFMIGLVKKLLLRTVESQANRILHHAGVQDGIQTGLLGWAKFSTGQTWHSIVPGSVEFFTEGAESGLRYQVQ